VVPVRNELLPRSRPSVARTAHENHAVKIEFGRYKGRSMAEIPSQYLSALVKNIKEDKHGRSDVIVAAESELKYRDAVTFISMRLAGKKLGRPKVAQRECRRIK
jgi:hypothetical protein